MYVRTYEFDFLPVDQLLLGFRFRLCLSSCLVQSKLENGWVLATLLRLLLLLLGLIFSSVAPLACERPILVIHKLFIHNPIRVTFAAKTVRDYFLPRMIKNMDPPCWQFG